MTTVEAIFNEQVDRRALLVGLLGAGAVAFGGAVYESLKMPRDGEALQALHAVQAAAAEIAKHGVDAGRHQKRQLKRYCDARVVR